VRVYYLLQLYCGTSGSGALSSAQIARHLHVTRKTALTALRKLVALRIITTTSRQDGKAVVIRFLVREIYRLHKASQIAVAKRSISFSESYPQDALPPPYNLIPPEGGVVRRCSSESFLKERRDYAEDALTSERRSAQPCVGAPATPGVAMEVLRGVVNQMGFPAGYAEEDFSPNDLDRTAKALLDAFGRFVIKQRGFTLVQTKPDAFESLLEEIETGEYSFEHPGTDVPDTQLHSWARALINLVFGITPRKSRDYARSERRAVLLGARGCA
jgi:hypothetical protein